jgi:hypothetical protein
MQLSLQKVQTGTETKVSSPYDVASHLAYSKGFKTLKEYTDYVVSNKMVSFLPDPTKYPQYTTAWNFLGTSRTQYYANRSEILVSKRDQEAINAKCRATRARNKAEREAKLEQAVSVSNLVRPLNTFTAEDVIDILVNSDANIDYIAEFIKTHKVNDAYAVKVLVSLLKSKTQVAITK